MNAAENYLIQSLTGKLSLHNATISELEDIAVQYPYFSIGQLLYAKKLKQEQSDGFANQWHRCAVYFQDIAWLQGKLYTKNDGTLKTGNATVEANTVDISASVKEEGNAEILPVPNEVENANLITLPAEDVLEDFTLQITDVKDEPEELPPLDEEELAPVEGMEAALSPKIADVLQHQVEDFKAPVEEAELPISTEPYHTIDYFASQGIKVDNGVPDAFTKKVHTFTDWLRQMKRISNYPTDLGSDPDMESFVQSIADTSNQLKAIDTEAMAAVLVKQGKLDKAIEVYEKLSLLNPGKTAYFAAKINQLKKQ